MSTNSSKRDITRTIYWIMIFILSLLVAGLVYLAEREDVRGVTSAPYTSETAVTGKTPSISAPVVSGEEFDISSTTPPGQSR